MRRFFGVLGGAALLLVTLAFSAILFVVLLVVFALFGTYFWWRTRELRQELRQRMAQAQRRAEMDTGASGVVVDGEVIDIHATRIEHKL